MKRYDLTQVKKDCFYEVVYPIFYKEFLIESRTLLDFIGIVETLFILNNFHKESIIRHWEQKESILINAQNNV